jgi:hypothetical protein
MLDVSFRPQGSFAPFRVTFSLDPVLEFWQNEEQTDANGLKYLAGDINKRIAAVAELRGALDDFTVLDRHRDLLSTLFSALLPAGLRNLSCTALAPPAAWDFFHATERFRRQLLHPDGTLRGQLLLDGITWDFLGRLYSYLAVLRHCYGIGLPFEKSVLVQVESDSGLLETYQMRAHFDMVRIRPVNELPPLDEALLARVQENLTSLELWDRLLPADAFEYYGLVVYEATEVSEEVTRAQLTELLVQPDPLIDLQRFHRIEKLMRTFLRLPELELALIGIEGDEAFCMDGLEGLRHGMDRQALDQVLCSDDLSDLARGQPIVIADLKEVPLTSAFMECLHREGARSVMLLPLSGAQEEECAQPSGQACPACDAGLAGALCLTTDHPGQLTLLTRLRLKGLSSVFWQALRRTLADVQARVQAVLKEKFTSIHPSVEWKFRAAALHYVRTQELEDVIFPDVYSLYSASDIRSSSEMRNRAIQSDLIRQVATAKSVLEEARDRRQVDYLSTLIYRLERLILELENGVRSGDEARVSRLLDNEVEPLFVSLQAFGGDVHDSIEGYRRAVCADSGALFTQRRAYEEAVDRLTQAQTAILTQAQEKAQRVFPHLFQMYRTDGVEHTIYVGRSLAERNDFSLLYLKNLRLWQLRTVAEIARASAQLEGQLSFPLRVAHLILAQSDPIGLRFSQEEKKFNVDGAYNTRYEIIKKRIDKANVKDSQERVTQPGKIAIFFSQSQEEQEYRLLIDYLQQQNVLEHDVERIEVEDLQGVHGLRALRVAVAASSGPTEAAVEENENPVRLLPGVPKGAPHNAEILR